MSSGSENSKLILTVPLVYTSFVKPSTDTIVFEAPSSRLHWRPIFNEVQQNNPYFMSLSKDSAVIDNLASIRNAVNNVNTRYLKQGIVSIVNEYRCKDNVLSLSIIGRSAYQTEMNSARLQLFQSYTKIIKKKVYVSEEFLFEQGQFTKEFANSLGGIADFCNVCLYVTAEAGKFKINIIAEPNAATMAENRVRLAIDAANPRAFVDYVDVGHISLLPLIGGTHYFNFKNIVKRTNCHLYLPHITPDLFTPGRVEPQNKIYITGVEAQVSIAKNMLNDLFAAITKTPFVKSALVMPIKRELLLSMRNDDWLQDIMFETGCFIQAPPFGSSVDAACNGQDVIRFQGNSTELVESAIEKFMLLITSVYTTRYTLKSRPTNLLEIQSLESSTSQLFQFTDMISSMTNTIVSVAYIQQPDGTYCHTFDIIGEGPNIAKAVSSLENFSTVVPHIKLNEEVVYQLELPNKEREFIGGKKNGKILKIMNAVPVSVKIIPFTDYNFFVEIASKTLKDSLSGLQLFEEELPTFDTFNIPESFHRQIIGAGGSTIQTIMRRHNVFIKFFNSYEFIDTAEFKNRSNIPQSLIRKNNVVIKCPAKNKFEIPHAKEELEKLVERVAETSHNKVLVKLSRSQWRFLATLRATSERHNFISELEKKHSTCIKFPMEEPELYSDLEITGPENNSVSCAIQLQSLLPHEYEFKLAQHKGIDVLCEVDSNSKILRALNSEQYKLASDYLSKIVAPLKLCYDAEVQILKDPKVTEFSSGTESTEFGNKVVVGSRAETARVSTEPEYYSLIISFKPAKVFSGYVEGSDITASPGFSDLSGAITNFLREHKFMIVDKGMRERKRQILQVVKPDPKVNLKADRMKMIRNKENLYDNGYVDSAFKPKTQQNFEFHYSQVYQNPFTAPQYMAPQPQHNYPYYVPQQPQFSQQVFQVDPLKFHKAANKIN